MRWVECHKCAARLRLDIGKSYNTLTIEDELLIYLYIRRRIAAKENNSSSSFPIEDKLFIYLYIRRRIAG